MRSFGELRFLLLQGSPLCTLSDGQYANPRLYRVMCLCHKWFITSLILLNYFTPRLGQWSPPSIDVLSRWEIHLTASRLIACPRNSPTNTTQSREPLEKLEKNKWSDDCMWWRDGGVVLCCVSVPVGTGYSVRTTVEKVQQKMRPPTDFLLEGTHLLTFTFAPQLQVTRVLRQTGTTSHSRRQEPDFFLFPFAFVRVAFLVVLLVYFVDGSSALRSILLGRSLHLLLIRRRRFFAFWTFWRENRPLCLVRDYYFDRFTRVGWIGTNLVFWFASFQFDFSGWRGLGFVLRQLRQWSDHDGFPRGTFLRVAPSLSLRKTSLKSVES